MHSFDPNTEMGLTETAYQFTAGVLKNARGFTAVCNPLVNSYKRLVPVMKHHVILHGAVKPFTVNPCTIFKRIINSY